MTSFKNFNKLQKDSWKFTVEIQVFWEDLVRAPDWSEDLTSITALGYDEHAI